MFSAITGFSERSTPKPHVVFQIAVSLSSQRAWTVLRRYSDFTELDQDMKAEASSSAAASQCPAALPPKQYSWSAFGVPRSLTDPDQVESRRAALERYLRILNSHKDATWRSTLAFQRFLEVPVGRAQQHLDAGGTSPAAWLDDYETVHAQTKTVRSQLSKRDALMSRGQDASEARKASVEAKATLATLTTSLKRLSSGMDALANQGMAQGELRRRTDMLSALQDEVDTLGKLASNSVRPSTSTGRAAAPGPGHNSTPSSSQAPPSAARMDLLGAAANGNPPGRALGRKLGAAVETDQTRALDNQGLLQLQQQEVEDQDSRLGDISAILRRQRMLGEEIGREVGLHNDMIDGLDKDVDQTTDKMSKVRQKIKRCAAFPDLSNFLQDTDSRRLTDSDKVETYSCTFIFHTQHTSFHNIRCNSYRPTNAFLTVHASNNTLRERERERTDEQDRERY